MSAKMSLTPSTSAPGAIAASATRRMRIATPLHHENFRSSSRRSPAGSSVQSLMSKSSLRRIENRSEEHTSELQSRPHLVCRLLLEKKKEAKDENVNPPQKHLEQTNQ